MINNIITTCATNIYNLAGWYPEYIPFGEGYRLCIAVAQQLGIILLFPLPYLFMLPEYILFVSSMVKILIVSNII
jgi:hypothetical protein